MCRQKKSCIKHLEEACVNLCSAYDLLELLGGAVVSG